jgi:hypothetical protein
MEITQARIVDVPLDELYSDHVNKGEFVEMEPDYLTNMFKDLITEPGYELGPEFDLAETHGADYYAERNPGFPDEWYHILAEEHKLLNNEYRDTSALSIKNDTEGCPESTDDCEPKVEGSPPSAPSNDIEEVEPKVEQLVHDPPTVS